MRVVYLHQYFNTPKMVGSTRSFEFARRLVAWGHEVHMITSWRDSPEATPTNIGLEEGVKVYWLPVSYSNEMTYLERIIAFLKFAFQAARRAASIDCDVIFATSTPLTIAIPGVYVSRLRKIPLVFEVRDLWPEVPIAIGALRSPVSRWLARRLERFAYDNSTRIVALSSGMAAGIERAGYPRDRVTVIPNTADLERFRPDGEKSRAFRVKHPELGDSNIILYPGTIGKINGLKYIVDLAVALQEMEPSCKFVVIGAGAETEIVRKRASACGVLDRNFFMYPPQSKDEITEAFSAATAVLSVCIDNEALEANCANKFFDGLASGTPVIVNYGGWQAHLLEQRLAGLRLSRDVQVAAVELMRFLSDQGGIATFGKNARRLAEAEFSCEVLSRRLEMVLLEAVR